MKLVEVNYAEFSNVSEGMDIRVMWDLSDNGLGYEVSVWNGEEYDAALNIGEYELGSGITKITEFSSKEEMFEGLEMIYDIYLKALKTGDIKLEEAFTLCSNLTENDIREKLKEDTMKNISSKYRKMRTKYRSVKRKEKKKTNLYIFV